LSNHALHLMFAIGVALLVIGCRDVTAHQTPDGGDSDADTDADTDTDTDTDSDSDIDPEADNDGDGLTNGLEVETGSDPNDPDSDDDGSPDFVEWVAGTDPNAPDSNPMAEGDFYFISPYMSEPFPETAFLVFTTGEAASELSASVRDDDTDDEDAAALLERVSANIEGGVADPTNPELVCTGGLATVDDDSDTIPDRFVDVPAGTTVCFDVVPAENETIPGSTIPIVLPAFIDVGGDGATALDTRSVYFLLPPSLLD